MIAGETATTANLIKAAAGLWPWSEGRIEQPAGIRMFVMPQRPYLPVGPLRDAICYPLPAPADEAVVAAALRQVGLDRLVDLIGLTENWEQVLTAGEQQRIGFARLLLCRPDLVLMLEAIDALDAAGEVEMMRLLARALPDTAVLAVGERPPAGDFYHRVLVARRDDGTVTIKPSPSP
jgi:putative ATP-binding cassette transporter